MKCFVTKVQLGSVEFDGLMDSDGKYYVAVPQAADMFGIKSVQGNAARGFKRLLGETYKTVQAFTEFNKKKIGVLPLDLFEVLVAKLDRSGNKAAQDFRDAMVGLSLHQLFSDSFGVKFEKEERQEWLTQRQSGKITRRTFTDAIRDYVSRHPENPPMDSKFIYANASDYVNLRVMGRRAKQIKADFQLSDHGSVRDVMSVKELSRVEMIEDEATIQVDEFDIHPCEAVRRVSDVLLFTPSNRVLVS